MKKLLYVVIIFLCGLFFFVDSVFATEESIARFESTIVLQKDGTFHVTENISYDFGTNDRHGIFRAIPLVSHVGDLYRVITITFDSVKRNGANEPYSISYSLDMATIKIGNPDKTVSGIHTYTISYNVSNGIGSNYEDHDELYWNVTGNQWKIPIYSAHASVTTDFGASITQSVCYTGFVNSTVSQCTAVRTGQKSTINATVVLQEEEGLTIVVGFPANTFPKSILNKTRPGSGVDIEFVIRMLTVVSIGLNFVLAPLLLFWYFKTKRKNRFGPLVVSFDIPKDENRQRILPAEAGTIDTARLERDDVIATLFDLAIRKYVKIEQTKKGSSFLSIDLSNSDYTITKLKDEETLTLFERKLFDRLFENGNSIKLSQLRNDFYKTYQELEKEVFKSLVEHKYYTKNPKMQRGFFIFLGVVSAIFLQLIFAIVLFWLAKKLNGRTAFGDSIDWKIDGLKMFLSRMTPNYKWQAEQLALAEQMIPYAIALGYISQYMEQLHMIYPGYQPTWYAGQSFYTNSQNMFSSFSNTITTSAPSSSSGFSGGSSGGGGGGGGGGSW